jgi:hypothetical protein
MLAMRWLTGRVEASDNGFVGVVHGCGGHGLKETEAGGVIFIMVGKELSLAGSGGVNRGKRWSGSVGGSIGGTIISGIRLRSDTVGSSS